MSLKHKQSLYAALLLIAFTSGIFVYSRDPISACAAAPPLGRNVEVAEESAIIVWDENAGVEHFIRRATFRSDAPDFGFLVPTPSVPDLNEASDELFVDLEKAMLPETIVEERHGIRPVSALLALFSLGSMGSSRDVMTSAPPVRVLATKTLSGYDATVLEADDAAALIQWLQEHGYAAGPSLMQWFQVYIDKKWKITAFKISANGDPVVATSPVRMSFKTDAPFFPYREPEIESSQVNSNSPRLLRIFFLGNKRMEGHLGAGNHPWPGKISWTDRLKEKSLSKLKESSKMAKEVFDTASWLTVFEDNSSPRPGSDDLLFQLSESQNRIIPPPLIEISDQRISIPVDLIILIALTVAGIVLLRRKRKTARA